MFTDLNGNTYEYEERSAQQVVDEFDPSEFEMPEPRGFDADDDELDCDLRNW